MRRLLFVAILFFQAGLFTASAQVKDLIFQHLTRSNGLPVNKVTCLAQDSSGFIWMGTEEGLYRYDGFTFKAFSADLNKESSLPGNWIQRVYVTRKNLLWITIFGGGAVLMHPNGKVLKVINSFTSSLFSEGADIGNEVKEDRNGNIWITTGNGLFLVSPDGSHIKRFLSPVKEQNVIRPFIFDEEDNLWLGTLTGLLVFDTKKMAFRDERHLPSCCSGLKKSGRLIHTLAFYHDELWYSSWWPDLGIYDTVNNTHTILYSGAKLQRPDFDRMATAFFTDSRNNLWIATLSGLYVREEGEKEITARYVHETENPNSLINDRVNAILEDRDGNFWFGTDDGISIARPYRQWPKNFSINNKKLYPFGDKDVNDIIEVDSNRLLVATNVADGLYLTDRDFRVKKHFSFKTRYDWIWTHYTDEPRKRIFISTYAGMLLYDIKSGRLKIDNTAIFKNRHPVSAFVSVSDSVIWLTHFKNTFGKWNLITGDYKEYDIRNFGLRDHNLLIEKDNKNNIWLLPSGASPFRFDDITEKITEQFEMNGTPKGLHRNGIYFLKDLDDFFLIGYELKGLTLYNKKSKTYEHFSKTDGLPSNEMYDAVVGRDGSVWIASKNGVIHFNPRQKNFKSYGFGDGILGNNFEFITQLKDGRIVAGSQKGLISFLPAEMEKLYKPPAAPVFTNIEVYGRSIFIDSLLDHSKPVYVPYKKNYFSIEFISLQYHSSRQLEYAFMIEGLDNDWTYAGQRRSVTYSKLKGGNYNFRVKARELGGKWIEAKQSLPVLIQTPFFEQWWFYVLCAAFVAVFVYGIFRYRLKQLLEIEKMRISTETEKEKMRVHYQKELFQLEAQALRAQMNPHFIFNSMNSIKALINKNDNDKAAGYLTTFSKLIRTLFQNSDKREISLFEEIETCKLYTKLEQMRFDDKIEFVFNVEDSIDLKDIKVPALILQPIIENAIWHGLVPKETGGKIVFSVKQNNGVVQCIIDDDGIGRELSKKYKADYEATHQSKGIGLTQSRLELDKLLNEREDDIFIVDKEGEDGKPAGTKVIITFKDNHL